MIAVMGPTGSGKTTLLTNLAARGEGTYDIGGEVRYGGQEWSKALKRRLGFVEQEDLVAAELTVRQNLNVAAQLRLPQHRLAPSGEEADPGWLVMNRKLERVEEVIRMLHMEKCADTVVGSAGARGVSGGEKKRLCIGMELLTEPKFLFFDEPTSGLDSSHALLVAKCMRDLCRSGMLRRSTSREQKLPGEQKAAGSSRARSNVRNAHVGSDRAAAPPRPDDAIDDRSVAVLRASISPRLRGAS